MTRSQKGFAHILPLLLVLILVGIGGWWMWNNDKPAITNESDGLSDVVYNDWLTYESTLYSFKYPKELQVRNTRNAFLILDGVQNIKSTDDYFTWPEPDYNVTVGSVTKKVVNNKTAYIKRSAIHNEGLPINNIRQVAIEGISFYKNHQWHDDGVLYMRIHIDEGLFDIDEITDLILSSFAFRNAGKEENINIKANKLTFNIPYKWWYHCQITTPDGWYYRAMINEQIMKYFDEFLTCRFNTLANTRPYDNDDGSAQFFLRSYKTSPDHNYINKLLLKDVSEKTIKISDLDAQLTSGVVDPEKYFPGNFGQPGDHVASVEINSPDGYYIFYGLTYVEKTRDDYTKEFDQILSTFEFIE